MCDLRERQGDDADLALWSPGRLQEVLREDDTDGSVPATPPSPLRHLQGQDPAAEGKRATGHLGQPLLHGPSSQLRVPLLHVLRRFLPLRSVTLPVISCPSKYPYSVCSFRGVTSYGRPRSKRY